MRLTKALLFFLLAALAAPTLVLAVNDNSSLALTSDQTWLIPLGAVVPLVTYALNNWAPWAGEHTKAVVQVVVAAAVGAVYKLIQTGDFAVNGTNLKFVLLAVFSALGAHHLIYKPAGVNVKLGANGGDAAGGGE